MKALRAPAAAAALFLLLLAGCGESGGETVEGSGYTYAAPDGWEIASEDEIADLAPIADSITVDADDDEDGFVSNINVIATGPTPADTDLELEVDRSIETLQDQPEAFGLPEGTEVTLVEDPAEITLDGAAGFQYGFETDVGTQVLLQRQIISISPEGGGFTVTASSVGETSDRDAAMDEVIDSWAWE